MKTGSNGQRIGLRLYSPGRKSEMQSKRHAVEVQLFKATILSSSLDIRQASCEKVPSSSLDILAAKRQYCPPVTVWTTGRYFKHWAWGPNKLRLLVSKKSIIYYTDSQQTHLTIEECDHTCSRANKNLVELLASNFCFRKHLKLGNLDPYH